MSIYYNQRVQPLKRLYDKLGAICKAHIAIATFECGDKQSFSTDDALYPLAYLETINSVSEGDNKQTDIYSITLNVLDIIPTDASEEQIISLHDKCKQIADEIKTYLEQKKIFGHTNVSGSDYLIFNESGITRVRSEFKITVEKLQTDIPDLNEIFKF